MEQIRNFERITIAPEVMGGTPCIRGMRVTVNMIISQIVAGQSIESLLDDFPYLEREDITQSLHYAAVNQGTFVTMESDNITVRALPLR